LRDEFDKENDLNNSTDDDILSLLRDYQEEESDSDKASEEAYYEQNDNSEMEDTDEDLLALLDMISAQDEENTNKNNNEPPVAVTNADKQEELEEELSLPEDILSIDDLPSEISDGLDKKLAEDKPNGANDMGGIFSDVLSAVDSLKDKDEPTMNSTNLTKPAGADKNRKEGKEQKKKGFFQKIFGKNKDDQAEISNQADNSSAEQKKAEKKNEKPEKKNAEKVKKAAKPKKTKMAKQSKSASGSGDESEKADKKAKVKKAAKKKPEKKQAVKKVKKQKTAKVTEGIEDNEEYAKINKLAIIFVMTFFILIGGFVILGTNMYSYSLEVQNADVDFARQRYTEAYKEIYGLDIKKKDAQVYDRIMTVMFVNKELNSYNNYMDIKKYPEALDSLLKGLERYDKYIKHATDLGIKSDMDYVKKQIVKELKQEFNISEEEANTFNNIDDQTKYSINVINTVLEKKK
jgi:hypothetical protein